MARNSSHIDGHCSEMPIATLDMGISVQLYISVTPDILCATEQICSDGAHGEKERVDFPRKITRWRWARLLALCCESVLWIGAGFN